MTQEAGEYPPQETGLMLNSWYGKFHTEMRWMHQALRPPPSSPDLARSQPISTDLKRSRPISSDRADNIWSASGAKEKKKETLRYRIRE